jgi:hypothetical protein
MERGIQLSPGLQIPRKCYFTSHPSAAAAERDTQLMRACIQLLSSCAWRLLHMLLAAVHKQGKLDMHAAKMTCR